MGRKKKELASPRNSLLDQISEIQRIFDRIEEDRINLTILTKQLLVSALEGTSETNPLLVDILLDDGDDHSSRFMPRVKKVWFNQSDYTGYAEIDGEKVDFETLLLDDRIRLLKAILDSHKTPGQ